MVTITSTTETFYDFLEMITEVDRIIGYDQRRAGKHIAPGDGDFSDWHKKKGYPEKDADGKQRGSSQIWFKEYQAELEAGTWTEPPHMDFWHWQLENCCGEDFHNDSYSTVYIGMKGYNFDKAEPWQLAIQQVYYDTFKDIANENNTVKIWVCW